MLVAPQPLGLDVERELDGDVPAPERFLDVRRVVCRLVPPGRAPSASFRYDAVTRRALDAAVIVPHTRVDDVVHVLLRSALRVPIALRDDAAAAEAVLWEVPAGLVEPGEPPDAAARRELAEETGLAGVHVAPLGPAAYPAPAVVGERHHFFHAAFDADAPRTPTEDGSVLEAHAELCLVSLAEALDACRAGRVRDAKTELALRRLAEVLA